MIYIGSRYQDAPVQYMLDGRTGKTRPTVLRPNPSQVETSTVTRWEHGTRIDIYGSALFNDPEQWWRIIDQNTEILDPMSMQPGTPLNIP